MHALKEGTATKRVQSESANFAQVANMPSPQTVLLARIVVKENNYRKEWMHRHTTVNQNAQIVRSESMLGTWGQPTVSNVQVQKQREQPLVKVAHRVNR